MLMNPECNTLVDSFFSVPISLSDTLLPLLSIIQHYITEKQYKRAEIPELLQLDSTFSLFFF